jgi:microcystin-dependent protein
MSVNLSPVGNAFQFFNNEGLPLNGGKLFTYQAGSTTPFPTYTDVNGLIANTNPIILGTDGRPPSTIWLTDGFFYKFILTDANDVTIQTYDNLYGIIGTAPSPPTPIPSGVILLWSGSIGSIPSGYVLCNGSNGTPDLRNRFVVGAGSTYAVDATGGSADAIVVSHTHTATSVVTDPGHTHTGSLTQSTKSGTGPTPVVSSAESIGGNYNYTTASQTTGITVATTNASAGTSGTGANLPPYYALCYIMKT